MTATISEPVWAPDIGKALRPLALAEPRMPAPGALTPPVLPEEFWRARPMFDQVRQMGCH